MKLKPLSLKNINISNNVFMAPMAGYTEYPFRHIAVDDGAGLTFTELVSAKGIIYKSKGNARLLYSKGIESKTSAQIFGSEPDVMRAACESEELAPFDLIDINMGCLVPKVYKNGDGSALLNDINKASEIVKACVKSGKVITVKIRIGLKEGDDFAAEFTKMAEDCGASLVTVHGRVREKYYSGEPNYKAIERAKNVVKIPVIANGGIFTEADATAMMDKTGADGVMVARGAFFDPFLIAKLTKTPYINDLKAFIKKHFELMRAFKGERSAVEFRKFITCYLKGIPDIKEKKLALLSAKDNDELLHLIDDLSI